MVGNCTTRTITFMVGQTGMAELVADALPAYLDREVNFDLETDLSQTPEVIVRVTDATGKLVWKTTTSNFPVSWDMKDMNGNKVPAGLYRYFGTYNDGTNHGGTAINKLIVLDALKVAQAD
jgi:flagellar hook assembly protein FlgD